jgi:exosortase K
MMAVREKAFAKQRVAIETRLRANAYAYGLTAFAAIALKYRYGKASAEDLFWLVAPLARFVELLTGIRFNWEPPAGFVSTTDQVIIAPACSGITFLVICFCTLSFSLVHRRKKSLTKLTWVALALFAAYAVTLCANTVRIIAAIYLYRADIYGEWITPERVHRMVGIAVYLGVLLLVYLATERITRRRALPLGSRSSEICAYCPPFAWYILFTIMIPVLRTLGRQDAPLLIEHVLVVGFASAGAFAACLGLAVICARRVDLHGREREDDRRRPFTMCGINAIKEQEAGKR